MDDLISRGALIEQLEKQCGKNTYIIPDFAWETIENAPTAFNKEDVIEELKEIMRSVQFAQSLIGTDLVQCGGFSYGYYNGVKDVIKIVKKGGVE